jgi:hypothetical protein
MFAGRLLIGSVILATCSIVGSAGIIPPTDPDIILDAGGDAMPLTTGTNFVPDADGGGTFDYFNPFQFTIVALTFHVSLLPGLGPDVISSDFNCSSGFFETCNFTYTSQSGLLTIDFATDHGNPVGAGIGQMAGIPPLCQSSDNPQCDITGFFEITIDGWSDSASPGLFNCPTPGAAGCTPTFTTTDVVLTPEPSEGILFASVLLIGAAFTALGRRRLRKTDSSRL